MIAKTYKAVAVSPGRVCPACKAGELQRSRRNAWMHWVPSSKYYICSKCKSGVIRLFDTFQLRMDDATAGRIASMSSRNGKKKLLMVFSAIAGLVYACYRIVISLYESALQ